MKVVILVLSLVWSGVSFAKTDCSNESNYGDVSLAEMQKITTEKSAVILDVNSRKSFTTARIGNAIHFGANKNQLAKVLPKDKSAAIVAYCGGPSCGAWKRAAVAACKMGYKNIRHFSEGITGWKPPKKG